MTENPFFTIIITAYNIDDYIEDCIKSIKNQTFTDYECFIVDDASTDRTVDVIKKSIEGDSRFELICASHGGQQRANNIGLKKARGKFLLFPDGDDTLDANCLSDCAANADGCDMLIFGINYKEYFDNKIVSETPVSLKEMEFASGAELADWYILHRKLLLYSNANKCYRRETMIRGNVGFNEKLSFGDDRAMNFEYLKICKKIKTLSGVYYNYRRINSVSRSRVFRPHFIDDLLILHELELNCMLGLSKKTGSTERKRYEVNHICRMIRQAFEHLISCRYSITDDVANKELQYLNTHSFPDYLYTKGVPSKMNLIDYINSTVFVDKSENDISDFTTVIVLGSRECKYRIEYALNMFGHIRYVCCGGNLSEYKDNKGHKLTEADFMCRYLADNGITDAVAENESQNTVENIVNSTSLIDSEECTAVVTAAFHKKRVEQILQEQNLLWKVIPVYGPNTKPDNWYSNETGLQAVIGEYERLI